MISLSYSRSTKVEMHLQSFDTLRREIACIVLPRQTTYFLRWEAMVHRLYAVFHSRYEALTKRQIIGIMSRPRVRKTQKERLILGYKEVIEEIVYTWLVSPVPIDGVVVERLAGILHVRIKAKRTEIDHLLEYLHTSREHPLISAGIAYLQFRRMAPFTAGNDLMAWIISYLYLYAGGVHHGDMLVLEELPEYEKDWEAMVELYQDQNNQTLWLEYFSDVMGKHSDRILSRLRSTQAEETSMAPEFVWKLTDRQKEILLLMDQPGVRMTNRKVQKGWNISQITASRDLAVLAGYGLIYPQGKGRSVYYTRV